MHSDQLAKPRGRTTPPRQKTPLPDTPGEAIERVALALANRTRSKIIALLHSDGPQTGKQLAQWLGVSAGTTKHHLNVLYGAAIIDRKEGRSNNRTLEFTYSVSPAFVPVLEAAHGFATATTAAADVERTLGGRKGRASG